MKRALPMQNIDEARIVSSIATAEKLTSGEIRVYFSNKHRPDGLAAAKSRFEHLGMAQTRLRNAVLIYLAPKSRQFAVIGDIGIHAKCGDEFWNTVRDEMQTLMRQGQFTDAIVRGVETVGQLLAEHFPPDPEDRNELPDHPVED